MGGRGGDMFVFDSAAIHSDPDANDILRAADGGAAFDGGGEAAGDRIDLAAIDANTSGGGQPGLRLREHRGGRAPVS